MSEWRNFFIEMLRKHTDRQILLLSITASGLGNYSVQRKSENFSQQHSVVPGRTLARKELTNVLLDRLVQSKSNMRP